MSWKANSCLGGSNYWAVKIYVLLSGTPAACEVEVRKLLHFHWKVLSESFPTVYDTPILLNMGMSYTVGKLLSSTLQWFQYIRGTHMSFCVIARGVPAVMTEQCMSSSLDMPYRIVKIGDGLAIIPCINLTFSGASCMKWLWKGCGFCDYELQRCRAISREGGGVTQIKTYVNMRVHAFSNGPISLKLMIEESHPFQSHSL